MLPTRHELCPLRGRQISRKFKIIYGANPSVIALLTGTAGLLVARLADVDGTHKLSIAGSGHRWLYVILGTEGSGAASCTSGTVAHGPRGMGVWGWHCGTCFPHPSLGPAMGRYPWVEYFLFETLYFVLFYPTSHHTHRAVVLSGMIYLATQIYRTSEVTDPLITTYTLGSVIAFHFAFIVYLFCAEGSFPDHWRRVRDEVHTKTAANDSDNPPSNFPPLKKFWWMLDITYNPRVIGWVQEPRNHLPQHPPPSPQTFFWKTLLKIVYNVIVADLAASVFTGSSAFDSRAHDPADGPETYLTAVPLPRRMLYVLAFGARMASSFHVLHGILSLVCVVFGRSSPTLWPDLWGRWSDAYTIRRFWGYVFHETLSPIPATN